MKFSSVMHVVPAVFGPNGVVGGAERYVVELARHMAEVVPTTLISFGDKAREESIGKLKIRVLGNPWRVRGQEHNPFKLQLLREIMHADIVHCHQQHIFASSMVALTCRLTGRKVFVSDLGGGGWDISGYISTDRWYQGHLHISEYSRKVFGHAGKPWAHVILGGIDTQKFSPDERISRENMILFVGRLFPHKGVNDLIEAATPDMNVEIIGRPYSAKFTEDLNRLAQGKRVTFRHGCTDDELVDAYRRTMCVVLPSVYKDMYGAESEVPELLGQTLLEGMSCGAPAICTNVASMPEVVSDGVSGFIVPPNDPASLRLKLQWLIGRPLDAARMGQAGRQRVLEKFTWHAVVERCLKIYGIEEAVT
jgi:glycosyltransferase involved in cell wall biosynthesis